jgi:hypothetical protein
MLVEGKRFTIDPDGLFLFSSGKQACTPLSAPRARTNMRRSHCVVDGRMSRELARTHQPHFMRGHSLLRVGVGEWARVTECGSDLNSAWACKYHIL